MSRNLTYLAFLVLCLDAFAAPQASTSNSAGAFLAPSFDVSALQVSTANRSTSFRPLLTAKLDATFGDSSTLGACVAVTSDFFDYQLGSDSFFYSDISFYYRYRFVGGPIRQPSIPVTPTYGPIRFTPAPIPDSAYGPPLNLDLGARVFFATLRGAGGTALDLELARSYQGASLTLSLDHRLAGWRLYGQLEGGYTMLRGQMMMGAIELALTYNEWSVVAPGVRMRYEFISGTALADAGTGGVPGSPLDVDDQLLMLGAVLYFKM